MRPTRLKLTASELTDLVVQVRASMAYEKLKLGYEANRKQAVTYFQIANESRIEASVRMPEVYDVKLDIDFLSISTCSCLSHELCEHMAAVFFAVYGLHGQNPEQFMNECTAVIQEQQFAQELQAAKAKKAQEKQALDKLLEEQNRQSLQSIQSLRAALQHPVKQAPPAKKSTVTFALQETEPVEAWHRYFRTRYEQHVNSQEYDGDVDQLVEVLCAAAASWKPIQRGLFEIHARLFALLQLEDRYHTFYQSHLYFLYETQLSHQVYDCLDEIAELMADIMIKNMTDSLKSILEATAQFLEREFYYESFEFIDTYALYGMFWSKLSGTEVLRQQERNRLDLALDMTQAQEDELDFNIHARAFQDWLEGQDSEARGRLQGLETLDVHFLLNQLGALYENKAWNRLHPWLQWLLPYIQAQDGEEVEAYIYLWREFNKAKRVEAEFVETMAALLPHSEYHYSEYLLSKNDYQRWVDLQITTNTLPIYLETHDLRKVEKANPAYLLPLYHQAIEDSISKKNRDGYETAVDMLKTLQKLYKRLNDNDKWDVYLTYLVKKYNRLRTFKDELIRAKLVTWR